MARRGSKATQSTVRSVINDEVLPDLTRNIVRDIPAITPRRPLFNPLSVPERNRRPLSSRPRNVRVSVSAAVREKRSVAGAPRNMGQRVGHLNCRRKAKSFNAFKSFAKIRTGSGSRRKARRNRPNFTRRQYC